VAATARSRHPAGGDRPQNSKEFNNMIPNEFGLLVIPPFPAGLERHREGQERPARARHRSRGDGGPDNDFIAGLAEIRRGGND
jgi:hypothetical protein